MSRSLVIKRPGSYWTFRKGVGSTASGTRSVLFVCLSAGFVRSFVCFCSFVCLFCLFTCLLVCFVYSFVCFVCLSVCLFVCSFVCLFVC